MSPRPFPKKEPLSGRSVDLEPLSLAHLDELWACAADAGESFEYLRYGPFDDIGNLKTVVMDLESRSDQPFWAVRPKRTGIASGWLSLCDIDQQSASIEVGSIWYSPRLQRSRASREALFILMSLAMDGLEYERLVWRCLAENTRSFQAAERLGFTFEGTWRNAAFVKGQRFDVAWFSILASEWEPLRTAFSVWTGDANFDDDGHPKRSLGMILDSIEEAERSFSRQLVRKR